MRLFESSSPPVCLVVYSTFFLVIRLSTVICQKYTFWGEILFAWESRHMVSLYVLLLDSSTDAQSAACSNEKKKEALAATAAATSNQEGVRVNLVRAHRYTMLASGGVFRYPRGMFFHLIKELRNRCVHTHTSVFTNVLFTYCHRQMCSSS